MASLTPAQRDILVKTILGEARGEGVEGMEAVAHTIQNRANSGRYPSDPAAVARQPYQYSTWNRGEGGNNPGQFRPGTSQYESAAQVIDRVFGGQSNDPTNGALFYHTPAVNPGWAREVNRYGTTQLGNHIFYNGRPVPPRDIPNQVATALDVRRRVEPSTPSSMSPQLAAQRQLTAQLQGGQRTAPSQAFMGSFVPPSPQANARNAVAQALSGGQASKPTDSFYQGIYPQQQRPNLTRPGQVTQSVQGAQSRQDPALQQALQQSIARSQRTPMSTAPISYAGQERVERPVSIQTIATVPTRPQVSGAVSYAGQERNPPAQRSGVGNPPTTRVVPSVSVAAAAPRQATAAEVAAVPYSKGQTVQVMLPALAPTPTVARASTAPTQPALKPVGQNRPSPLQEQRAEQAAQRSQTPSRAVVQPNASQVKNNTGFRVPNLATQPTTVPKDQSRLTTPPVTVAGAGTPVPVPRLNVAMPTPSSQRPAPLIAQAVRSAGMPTPVNLRPVAAPVTAVARPAPLMAASIQAARPALNVVVNGSNTIQPAVAPSNPYAAYGVTNVNNHNAAQLAALAAGRSTYTGSDGGLQPTRAMNGRPVNTY